MSSLPLMIEEKGVSRAWARLFLHVLENAGKKVSPLVVSITGFEDSSSLEDAHFRKAMDKALGDTKNQLVNTVANTIFPQSLWRWANGDRTKLFSTYIDHFPRYQALAKRLNRRGLYFERLIAWSKDAKHPNQLSWIIEQYLGNNAIRRSALQASIFDPARDHVPDAQLGFPCLQQVSFVPDGEHLVMNAIYAKQSLFKKAYGNYLGLCRLGQFMAGEMKLSLERVNCFIGVEELETISKSSAEAKELQTAAHALLGQTQPDKTNQ